MKKLKLFILFLIGFIIIIGIKFILDNQNKKPLISVIMSTYNRSSKGEHLLSKAIESILNQTEKNFEFIIINDGSSDDTANILTEFQKKDSRIIILTNHGNKGLVYSLNRGLKISKGKYIARMDDDDFSLPERFQKQVAFLEKNKHITATGCSFQNGVIYPTNPIAAKIKTFWNVPVIHPCAMIRNDFIRKNKIQYTNSFPNAEDMPFWFDVIIKHGGLVANLPEILIYKKADSPKKEDYLDIQDKSWKQYHQYTCNYFNEIKKSYSSFNECIKDLLKNEKAKKIIEDFTYIIHPQWSDVLVIEGKKAYRLYKTKDKADVIEKNNNTLIIKWDKYGIEVFEKKDGIFYLKKIKQKK